MDHKAYKKARKDHYLRFVHGWKLMRCSACSGSGRYDHNGSPPCGACSGSGKERISPTDFLEWVAYVLQHSLTEEDAKRTLKRR
jgi:hypothetical protein